MAARARHIAHTHTMAETMDVITSEMVFRNSKAPPIIRFTCQFYATLEVRLRVRLVIKKTPISRRLTRLYILPARICIKARVSPVQPSNVARRAHINLTCIAYLTNTT